jgi:hypothetical protein
MVKRRFRKWKKHLTFLATNKRRSIWRNF